ncbi:hypothetical protein KBD75_02275 [Candidatus Woesebacteria bacterium]|nr:hypothetical protein [Candidatus Woesebacteria bacterium]
MNKYLKMGLLGCLLIVAIVANWRYSSPTSGDLHEGVHYHAGFRVYIDGVLQDYSDYKYMNFVPCSEHDEKKSPAEEQIEKAHLHDGVGDVVHVHRSGSTWGDLFKNIQVELPKDKELKGYIGGALSENIMEAPITEYTTAIFIVGENQSSHDKEIVSIDHIKEVEAKSELCGTGE